MWLRYALWAAAAGAFIPMMAVLNARLGKSLEAPAQAPVVLFAVALASALIASLALTGRLPSPNALRETAPVKRRPAVDCVTRSSQAAADKLLCRAIARKYFKSSQFTVKSPRLIFA
jgi:hypothetical protein